jgi:membrane protein implicated in regulation of membrane protease activity
VGAPWWLQLIVAAVVALLLLFFVKPPLLHALRKGSDPARSNVDALLGLNGVVLIDFRAGAGQVKLVNGDIWTARIADGVASVGLIEGAPIVVTAIEGATAVVVPASDPNSAEEAVE